MQPTQKVEWTNRQASSLPRQPERGQPTTRFQRPQPSAKSSLPGLSPADIPAEHQLDIHQRESRILAQQRVAERAVHESSALSVDLYTELDRAGEKMDALFWRGVEHGWFREDEAADFGKVDDALFKALLDVQTAAYDEILRIVKDVPETLRKPTLWERIRLWRYGR